jgi:hypothetical protein
MKSVEELEMKICEVNALMNLAENYSDSKKIGDLVKQRQSLEDEKNTLEMQWIEKSDEYETEFGSD